jgi:peptide/nickel transport system permease protein
MYRYVIKRILMLIPVLLGVTFVVFLIMSLAPGDPATLILGAEASAEDIMAKREELGLNDPLPLQYFNYVKDILRGDFGTSYKTGLGVSYMIMARFPNTFILAIVGITIALIIGVTAGIISAKKQYSVIDNITMVGALIGVSMPSFWLGLLLVLLFAVKLHWLPSSGMGEGLVPLLKSLILPGISLGIITASVLARMTRSAMLEVIRQDYIDLARSKGISEKIITFRHMLRNALIPIVTTVGLQFGELLGGAVLIETVFAWPGLGRYMVESIKSRDIPAVLGVVVFMAMTFSIVNLLVDILYSYIDPRIKISVSKR